MPRTKPRYFAQLDNALVELAQTMQVEIFQLETYILGCAVLSLHDLTGDDGYKSVIQRAMDKILLQHELLPVLKVERQTQAAMPF